MFTLLQKAAWDVPAALERFYGSLHQKNSIPFQCQHANTRFGIPVKNGAAVLANLTIAHFCIDIALFQRTSTLRAECVHQYPTKGEPGAVEIPAASVSEP
jgi:hypothetical protein